MYGMNDYIKSGRIIGYLLSVYCNYSNYYTGHYDDYRDYNSAIITGQYVTRWFSTLLRGFPLVVDESKSGATFANCRVAQLMKPVSSSLVTRLRRCYQVSFSLKVRFRS